MNDLSDISLTELIENYCCMKNKETGEMESIKLLPYQKKILAAITQRPKPILPHCRIRRDIPWWYFHPPFIDQEEDHE